MHFVKIFWEVDILGVNVLRVDILGRTPTEVRRIEKHLLTGSNSHSLHGGTGGSVVTTLNITLQVG